MNLRTSLLAAAVALLTTPAMADQVINFDDLSNGFASIPNGYAGLQWNNVYSTPGSLFPPTTGYFNGVVSAPNVATNGFGTTGTFSSNTPFSIRSIAVTSADSTKDVEFKGFSGGIMVYHLVFNVNELTPTLETLNFSNVTEVDYVAVGSVGNVVMDNIDLVLGPLVLTTSFAATPGLTPNQLSAAANVDFNSATPSPQLAAVIAGLQNQPASNLPAALGELTPLEFGQFTTMASFNKASFETEAKDNYLATERRGPNGTFVGGNGTIDASGLTLSDPSYDPGLAMIHSRMLAWNPAPFGTINDSVPSVLGGVAMKDPKGMGEGCCGGSDSSACCGYTSGNPWNVYVAGNVVLAQGFSQPGVSHFDQNTASVQIGADYRISSNFLVGLTAGYGHTDVTLDNNGSSATTDSYSPGIYASYADHGWYANFSGSYTHDAYTQSRAVSFLGQTANSAPEGNEGTVDLDGGYDFHKGAWTFGPIAGIQYTHLTVDGYTENGSDADLTVNEQQSDSLRSRLGGRVSYEFSHCGMQFTPHLDASWQHEFMDQSRSITSQFTGSAGSFVVQTASPSRDSALVDAGLNADLNQTVTLFADYMVQAGQENYFGQSVEAGAKFGF